MRKNLIGLLAVSFFAMGAHAAEATKVAPAAEVTTEMQAHNLVVAAGKYTAEHVKDIHAGKDVHSGDVHLASGTEKGQASSPTKAQLEAMGYGDKLVDGEVVITSTCPDGEGKKSCVAEVAVIVNDAKVDSVVYFQN